LPAQEVMRWSMEPEAHRPMSLRTSRSSAKLFVLHLWATWCKPCAQEFPRLKQMFPDGRLGEAQLVLVAVQSPEEELRAFLKQNIAGIPRTPHFIDANGALQRALNLSKLPITLLVDRQWVVRQAFYGSVAERRQELMESVERYLYPPLLTAIGGKLLECAAPPCIEPSFFLHRSLLLQETRRWQSRRRTLSPTSVVLPVSAQPNLIYLFTPTCAMCPADLSNLQKVVRGWRKARGSPVSFVVLLISGDPLRAANLLEQQQATLPDTLIVHSSMPSLIQVMAAVGGPVTLVMNRQGYVRNAFIGAYMNYQKAVTDALLQTTQER
jgi:thiol-disulfide isomerase/thioredoxin